MLDDGAKSYTLARACQREIGIRSGQIQPRADDTREQRWVSEGPVCVRDLDTVRDGG